MELFLLLSMGLSIVAFISIALNQAPTTSLGEQNLEVTLPIEHILSSSETAIIPQEDPNPEDSEVSGMNRSNGQNAGVATEQELLLVTAEA